MIKVKTWCLPELTQDELKTLHNKIVRAVVSIPELGVKDENDMENLFPSDAMEYGLGTEITIEITGLPFCKHYVRNRLANKVGSVVKETFPKANVECEAFKHDPGSGFWSSKESKISQEQDELPDDGHNFRDGVEQGPRDKSGLR